LLALLAITSVPSLAHAFGFAPLAPLHWLAAMVAGLAMLVPFQIGKRWFGTRYRTKVRATGG
jgi:Ca2+-transporting ATPase